MTNIRTGGIFPETAEIEGRHSHPNQASLDALFELRQKTYQGFALIEQNKGLLRPAMSLSSSQGQEAVRILIQRGFEEMVEAYESIDRDHFLEELIDALNYFWAIAILDPVTPTEKVITYILGMACEDINNYAKKDGISVSDLGGLMVKSSPFMEKLRHRAWMHNAQSPTFEGWSDLSNLLGSVFIYILQFFNNYQEFVSFFIAKDRVLQFRLSTKY